MKSIIVMKQLKKNQMIKRVCGCYWPQNKEICHAVGYFIARVFKKNCESKKSLKISHLVIILMQ